MRKLYVHGYRCEILKCGGIWVEIYWDYEESTWDYFESLDNFIDYLKVRGDL